MIKKIKKVEKWLLLILISFCVVFTMININEMGLGRAISFKVNEDNMVNMSVEEILRTKSHSDTLIVSLILGVLIGTGRFFIIDEDKKSVNILVLFYILTIFLLGFLEGINITSQSLLDSWVFPRTYIILATLMFGVMLVFIKIKQQNLAMELNKKLQEEKNKNQSENQNYKEREETFLEKTKETREKMAKIGSTVIEIIMILIVFIYLVCA